MQFTYGPIDYQVGDVIEPKHKSFQHVKSKVIDITEKGIEFQIIGTEIKGIIPHSQAHLMIKSKVGTLLYGSKDKKYSQG